VDVEGGEGMVAATESVRRESGVGEPETVSWRCKPYSKGRWRWRSAELRIHRSERIEAGSVAGKRLGGGTEVRERSEEGRGGRGKGTEVETSFSSTRSMMTVNDGKAEKELRATTVATSNEYLPVGEILAVGSYG